MGSSESRTAYSVLIRYVLTANLLSSTKSAYRPASGVPSGLLWPAWKWQPNLIQEASSARESLLLGFYWQHRLLKSLLLCGVYFYYNKIHSHCRASIIVNHIQTSVRFRCSSVVIKTYLISLGLRQTIVKSFLVYETGGRMHKALPLQGLPSL